MTGAGAGLGRIYSLMFARLGANIVVNDVSAKGAQSVVDEIKSGNCYRMNTSSTLYLIIKFFSPAGGKAVPAITSAEDGDGIVKTALENFGSIHVLIANAGILRDRSFTAMSEAEWDAVIAIHLRGTYKCIKACWPVFQKQKYGRILTTASGVGIYGNFGQANYSTAKGAIIGLTRTAAAEGSRYNILANVVAPKAGTAMTQTVWTPEMVEMIKPDYVAPIVGYLGSEANKETSGSLFEVEVGWAAQTRWERAFGVAFPHKKELTPEMIIGKWGEITMFGT